MIERSNSRIKAVAQFSVCLLLLMSVSLSCTLPRKFWRSYEPQPFDAQKWQNADAQERGTMFVDLYKKRLVHGKSKEEVLAVLGEPDKKSTGGGSEIWHYKVEFAGEEPVQYFPVTFDKNGRAGIGTARTDF
jgi:outer membrane protein assembly factor BamE (lipoprotein component of BamABCDE complex)